MKQFAIGLFAVIFAFVLVFPTGSFAQSSKKVVSPIRLGVDVGIGIPTGDFGKSINTGFGGNAVLTYFLQRNLLFVGELGYWNFSKSEGGVDLKFTTIPLNVGLHLRFAQSGLNPFVGLETLLFFNTLKSSYLSYSASDSETKFGIVPLVGIAYGFSSGMEFRANLKYTVIFTEGSNTTFLGVLVGLHFPL